MFNDFEKFSYLLIYTTIEFRGWLDCVTHSHLAEPHTWITWSSGLLVLVMHPCYTTYTNGLILVCLILMH